MDKGQCVPLGFALRIMGPQSSGKSTLLNAVVRSSGHREITVVKVHQFFNENRHVPRPLDVDFLVSCDKVAIDILTIC